MKDFITKRLEEMKDLDNKVLIREVLENVFYALYEESERKYSEVRRRVLDEIPLSLNQYCIHTGLIERIRLDGSHRYLFPMVQSDVINPYPSISELLKAVVRNQTPRLSTIFVKADFLVCRELMNNRRLWSGTISTDVGELQCKFRLVLSMRYFSCIEHLYKLFSFHNLSWITVNAPYLYKMFDIVLVRAEGVNEAMEKLEQPCDKFSIAFEKYGRYIEYDLVPVWNVQHKKIKAEDFPMPALDRVNYEYRFDLTIEGSEHGYLADESPDIIAARQEKEAFIVTSPKEKGLHWNLFKIWQRKDTLTEHQTYEVVSNRQEDSFAGRMMAHYGTTVKTRAELSRLIQSFEISEHIKFLSYQIFWGDVPGETYEGNGFIEDEVRDVACTKTMLLRFQAMQRGDILVRDIMSFLVSQIQLVFPEYRCRGVLV